MSTDADDPVMGVVPQGQAEAEGVGVRQRLAQIEAAVSRLKSVHAGLEGVRLRARVLALNLALVETRAGEFDAARERLAADEVVAECARRGSELETEIESLQQALRLAVSALNAHDEAGLHALRAEVLTSLGELLDETAAQWPVAGAGRGGAGRQKLSAATAETRRLRALRAVLPVPRVGRADAEIGLEEEWRSEGPQG